MANFLNARLRALDQAGRLRRLPGGGRGTDFWSNDYLGLATDPHRFSGGARTQVQGEFARALSGLPRRSGATGSRLISGDAAAHHRLEQLIADHHGFGAGLFFPSGYAANLGLLGGLLRRTDVVLYDELIHASCRDGIRLGQARGVRFPHNDPAATLQRALANRRADGEIFLLTEGRFSMDGDTAPLPALADLCARHGVHLIVDEAHSVGVDGPGGRGLVAHYGLQDQIFANVVTYGKAFGAHGATVLGGPALRLYLVNLSRAFIYTTGPAPAQWAAVAQAYDQLTAEFAPRRALLQDRIDQWRTLAAARLGLAPGVVATGPVQIVPRAGNAAVMRAEEHCRRAGLLVKGIRSPTVGVGQERLRVCLHAHNTAEELTRLVDCLVEAGVHQ